MNSRILLFTLLVILISSGGCKPKVKQDKRQEPVLTCAVAAGCKVVKLADGFRFTEGPVGDTEGNVYFTDIPNNNIMKYSPNGQTSVLCSNSGGANGLYFDREGVMYLCQGGVRQLSMITPDCKIKVIADKYDNKPFNSPNDLWLDGKGGVYFTDPRYGNRDDLFHGEHVYYLTPDHDKVIRVIDDMTRPNGLIGTGDGKTLYVADQGEKRTYRYTINDDGTLSNKKLFVKKGSDGMTIDDNGNIYITTDAVEVYSPDGNEIMKIEVPERPSNVTFAGKDKNTLYITARTSLYAVEQE